jgi:N-acetylmuramoyl-L-alanine amidase
MPPLLLLLCPLLLADPEPSPALVVPPPAAWPAAAAPLAVLPPPPTDEARRLTLVLDPGHGVATNSGNESCLCIEEQDHNLRVARHLAASLASQGLHSAHLSRDDHNGPGYQARIEAATARGADALISLHSDVRGAASEWSPREGLRCDWNDANPGFSVLYSDEGEPGLVAARLALARAIATHLELAGFLAYDGHEYHDLYQRDAAQPGVFLDRHAPNQRIRMLRRPTVPSVIIETHHARDRREEPRWREEATLRAFDAAVIAALATWAAERE